MQTRVCEDKRHRPEAYTVKTLSVHQPVHSWHTARHCTSTLRGSGRDREWGTSSVNQILLSEPSDLRVLSAMNLGQMFPSSPHRGSESGSRGSVGLTIESLSGVCDGTVIKSL